MDKETLSNYGWIVICVLVLAVMLALASPFGSFVAVGVKSTTAGLFETNQKALNTTGLMSIDDQNFDDGTIPLGGVYTKKDGTILSGNSNDSFPDAPTKGDKYEYGDYIYTYNKGSDYGTEWSVALNLNVTDKTKSSYGKILSEIAEKPVTNMKSTFSGCESLTTAPTIPSSVTSMSYTFYNCASLTTAPTIPNRVTNMSFTFYKCTSLTTAPTIPNSVTNMSHSFFDCTSLTTAPDMSNANNLPYMTNTFAGCKSLTTAPTIPSSVTSMSYTFSGCTSLTTAPTIPNRVTDMQGTFAYCTSLTTAPTIPNRVTEMLNTFYECTSLTTAPTIPNSVTNMPYTFSGCTSLTTAPAIPNRVTNMDKTFQDCTSLTTAPIIPYRVTNMSGTFSGCTALKTYTGSADADGDFSNYKIPNSVKDMPSTFYDCRKLIAAPTIPNGAKNINCIFQSCDSLKGTITIHANPTSYFGCFSGTFRTITLTGTSTKLNDIASQYSNVKVATTP